MTMQRVCHLESDRCTPIPDRPHDVRLSKRESGTAVTLSRRGNPGVVGLVRLFAELDSALSTPGVGDLRMLGGKRECFVSEHASLAKTHTSVA